MMDYISPMHPTVLQADGNGNTLTYPSQGMTQRLYVATEVMQGLLASMPWQALSREELVKEAYQFADALMDKQWAI